MHEFWYDYVKPKNGENTKLGYLDTESFVVYIKTEDIYVNMANYVATILGISSYVLNRSLPKGKNDQLIEILKDKLGGEIMRLASVESKNT